VNEDVVIQHDQGAPRSDGEKVPAGTLVFRIGKKADPSPEALHQSKPPEILFKPSSEDEESPGKRLSVWVEELTIADQAWAFMGSNPAKTMVVCLNVDAIRAIQPPERMTPLDVEWEQARFANGTVNNLPGAEGHSGIAGLLQGGEGKQDKSRRKALRSKLADIAEVSCVRVPHDIPEEHLRVAAYYIHEKQNGSAEADWVCAIRQMRRALVRASKQQA
jgi:hypothetical protein